jgi:perosamine synthetase
MQIFKPGYIPVSKTLFDTKEIQNVTQVFMDNWISSDGSFSEKAESEISKLTHSAYSHLVSNGSVSLHLALLALGVGPGDEVILPSMCYVAPANAVIYAGATPIFADIDLDNWCLNPKLVESLISDKTKVILTVHNYGIPGNISDLVEIARNYSLFLIEDAAEAMGASVKNQPIGSFGDITSFSFFGNKIITCGEGGSLSTQKAHLSERIRFLKSQAMSTSRRYFHPEIGYNYRLSNLSASVLCAQLEKLNSFLESRNQIFQKYNSLLSHNNKIHLFELPSSLIQSPWLFTFRINDNIKRDGLIDYLNENNVDSRPTFQRIDLFPSFKNYKKSNLLNSEIISNQGISVPTWVGLSDGQIDKICDLINKYTSRF